MSDLTQEPTEVTPEDQPQPKLTTIFKIGIHRITADETTAKLTGEEARRFLKTSYPEVMNATIRETIHDNIRLVEYLKIAGVKG